MKINRRELKRKYMQQQLSISCPQNIQFPLLNSQKICFLRDANITPPAFVEQTTQLRRADHHIPPSERKNGQGLCEHSEHLVLESLRIYKILALSWRNENAALESISCHIEIRLRIKLAPRQREQAKKPKKTWSCSCI